MSNSVLLRRSRLSNIQQRRHFHFKRCPITQKYPTISPAAHGMAPHMALCRDAELTEFSRFSQAPLCRDIRPDNIVSAELCSYVFVWERSPADGAVSLRSPARHRTNIVGTACLEDRPLNDRLSRSAAVTAAGRPRQSGRDQRPIKTSRPSAVLIIIHQPTNRRSGHHAGRELDNRSRNGSIRFSTTSKFR